MFKMASKEIVQLFCLFYGLYTFPWFCCLARVQAVQTWSPASPMAQRQWSDRSAADGRLSTSDQGIKAPATKPMINRFAWNGGRHRPKLNGSGSEKSLRHPAPRTSAITSDLATDESDLPVPTQMPSSLINTSYAAFDVRPSPTAFQTALHSSRSSALSQKGNGPFPASWKHARVKQREDLVGFAETPFDSVKPVSSPSRTLQEEGLKILSAPLGHVVVIDKPRKVIDLPEWESVGYETLYNTSSKGCGEWWPLNNNCFKVFFPERQKPVRGQPAPCSPSQADKTCRSKHGARLASLNEPGAKELVKKMIAKSTNKLLKFVSVDIRKVKAAASRLKFLYRFMWQWGDVGSPIAYKEMTLQTKGLSSECALLDVEFRSLKPVSCFYSDNDVINPDGFVCMKPNPTRNAEKLTLPGVRFPRASARPNNFTTRQCPDGSLTQTFFPCRWGKYDKEADTDWSPSNLRLFQCLEGGVVHYSLVCDGNEDCVDNSDEAWCQRPRHAPLLNSSFVCRNLQVIPSGRRCDGRPDCFDESDEEWCILCKEGKINCFGVGCVSGEISDIVDDCSDKSAIAFLHRSREFIIVNNEILEVFLDGEGMSYYRMKKIRCSEGFFRCQDSYCIPAYLLNNGEKDCPQGEDEGIPIHNMTCPDYYRCRNTGSCVHKDFVCDRIIHCPYKDDEMFCHWACPHGCTCEGQAYTCLQMFDPLQNLHVRYLDLSHSPGVSLENVNFMEYLFFLNLSSCFLGNVTLTEMFHLQVLDLSFNSLTGLVAVNLYKLPSLAHLDISNNPLGQMLRGAVSTVIKMGALHNLKTVIMSNVSLQAIEGKTFSLLTKLRHLDVGDNPIHGLDKDSLFGLTALEELYTDVSKLCCSYFHPSLFRCFAPVDELSSCSDLLAQDFFRVFLWVLSVLTVVGNTGVLIFRQFVRKQSQASPSLILVKNLCAADLLMGIYLVIVGVADAVFSGVYVAHEDDWKNSAACMLTGFLSFVSSEVSALTICLITLDRVLVICFPFTSRVHFSPRVTICACCAVWVTVVALAAVPLLAGLEFYGQSAICIPLPITRHKFSGQAYAFSVFIVLNFAVFIFIGLGQLFIYRAVRKASTAAGTERREQDLTVARRLFLVAFTDFCCWFPIGLMGLLAARGTPIPGEVNVWVAIFVLPLNSALNPFLYTLNGLLEQRRKQRMERTMKKMLSSLHSEIPKWQPGRVQDLMRVCLRSKLVGVDDVKKMLGISDETTPSLICRDRVAEH